MSNIRIYQLPSASVLTGTMQLAQEDSAAGDVTQKITLAQIATFVGSGGITTLDGDTGSATGSTVTVTGAASGKTVSFSGSGSTLTLNVSDVNLNVALGASSGAAITSDAIGNTFVGVESGTNAIDCVHNTFVGGNSGGNITSGSSNTLMGYVAGQNITTGNSNICVGDSAGNNLATSDSSNIVIGQAWGTAGDTNKTRIGFNFTNSSVQTACFIDGITATNSQTDISNAVPVAIDPSTGRLAMGGMPYNLVTSSFTIPDSPAPPGIRVWVVASGIPGSVVNITMPINPYAGETHKFICVNSPNNVVITTAGTIFPITGNLLTNVAGVMNVTTLSTLGVTSVQLDNAADAWQVLELVNSNSQWVTFYNIGFKP